MIFLQNYDTFESVNYVSAQLLRSYMLIMFVLGFN